MFFVIFIRPFWISHFIRCVRPTGSFHRIGLLLDSHASHVTPKVLKHAAILNIQIHTGIPNGTHVMQVCWLSFDELFAVLSSCIHAILCTLRCLQELDVSILFTLFKRELSELLVANHGFATGKNFLTTMLIPAWERTMGNAAAAKHMRSAFRSTGKSYWHVDFKCFSV